MSAVQELTLHLSVSLGASMTVALSRIEEGKRGEDMEDVV
jgi:hypothetical protein